MAKESISWQGSEKKKFKGFLTFLRYKTFKTALMGDIKLWSSRHQRRRHRYRRRHCRNGSTVEREMKIVKANY
jgi:hypothetical protein